MPSCLGPKLGLALTPLARIWRISFRRPRGSISSGKLADLIILDRDPTTVAKEDLLSLRGLETIKEGQPLYRSEKLPGS